MLRSKAIFNKEFILAYDSRGLEVYNGRNGIEIVPKTWGMTSQLHTGGRGLKLVVGKGDKLWNPLNHIIKLHSIFFICVFSRHNLYHTGNILLYIKNNHTSCSMVLEISAPWNPRMLPYSITIGKKR